MINITKEEAEYIRNNSDVKVTVTGRGKNKRQKKRYVEETSFVFRLLQKYHRNK